MSPRLAGAVLALIAAALLAISVVTSAWWTGHPSVEGRTIDKKTVNVGLHGAEGCNTGGDGACTTLDLPGAFTMTGYVAAGATGLLALAAIVMAIMTLTLAEARKALSTAVFVLAALAVLAAAALIFQGPKVGKASQHIEIPIGYGLYMFVAGVVMAILAGVLARRPAPKVELRPSRAAIAPALSAPPPAQQQPVDVLAFLQPEPPRPTAPAIATPLAGPAGYLAPQPPVFVAPPPPAPMPMPPPPPRTNPPAPPRASPPTTPPRTKPVSVPPPPPAIVPTFGTAEPPRTHPISVPPPPASRPRAGTQPPPPGAIAARLKASSVPPPIRPGALPKPPDPTVLPVAAPTTPKTLAGAVAPPPVAAKLAVRAETDPSELAETSDRDSHSVGDATDANVALPPESEHTSPSEPLDTEEGPVVRPPADTDAVATVAVPKEEPETVEREKVEAEVARQSMSEIATVARERISARELSTGDSTAETESKPAAEAPKIPLTTAPSTLPPPKEKQVATSGPSPACPQCEAPMAWVEEHLRFYCKSCRMYF